MPMFLVRHLTWLRLFAGMALLQHIGAGLQHLLLRAQQPRAGGGARAGGVGRHQRHLGGAARRPGRLLHHAHEVHAGAWAHPPLALWAARRAPPTCP